MTVVTGPETDAAALFLPVVENYSDRPPSFLRSVGKMAARVAGRTILPAVGIAAGAYIALHGAHYDTDIEGTRVTVTTDIDTTHPGVNTEVVIEDAPLPSQSLGGVDFYEFLKPLPVRIEAKAYPGAAEVDRTITERYDYINLVEREAKQKVHEAADYFLARTATDAGLGLVGGLLANELVAGAWRSRRRAKAPTIASHPVFAGLGHSALALAVLAGGGAYGVRYVTANLSHFQGYGAIGDAMKNPKDFSTVHLKSPALDEIFQDFQRQHACPETPTPAEHPVGSLTVTTYNIKRGLYSDNGIAGVARELARSESDVTFLQEVTPSALDQLSDDLGMQAIPGWTIKNETLTYGNAILTRLPVTYTQSISLPTDGEEPRSVLAVELTTPENKKPVLVADIHLTNELLTPHGDARAHIRDEEAHAAINRLLKIREGDEAVVVGGDLNQKVGGSTYNVFTDQFNDAVSSKLKSVSTFPANGLRFDNVFVLKGSGWKTLAAVRGGVDNSDHCLVSADLGMSDDYTMQAVPADAAGLSSATSRDTQRAN